MTEHTQLELIAACVTCFLSLMAYLKSRANSIDLKDLRVTFNGHIAQLVAANRAEGKAEGKAERNTASTADAAAAIKLIATAAEAAKEVIAAAERLKATPPDPPTHAPEPRS